MTTDDMFPRVKINDFHKTVIVNGVYQKVSPRCYKVLLAIVKANGRIVTRTHLLNLIWGGNVEYSEVRTRSIDQIVCRLRRVYKIQNRIETKTTWGYRWAKQS